MPEQKSSALTLQSIDQGDPFWQYPLLQTIWPEPLGFRARYDTVASLEAIDDTDFGAVYLILLAGDVVGLTGYYLLDDAGHQLGLRWHGLVPAQRGRGYSGQIVQQLLALIRQAYPAARGLIELIPDSDYGVSLKRHFGALGFVATLPMQRYPWSEDAWQAYRLPINGVAAHAD